MFKRPVLSPDHVKRAPFARIMRQSPSSESRGAGAGVPRKGIPFSGQTGDPATATATSTKSQAGRFYVKEVT